MAIILLDSGVLGNLCNPYASPLRAQLDNWLYGLMARGTYIASSTICDFEVRRSLKLTEIQGSTVTGIPNLDTLNTLVDFVPVDVEIVRLAAELWALARNEGIPTAADNRLDADLLICATARSLAQKYPGRNVIVATTNVKHLSRFVAAATWAEITL
jgi:predicted nucleic acid-binding protein